MRIILGGKGEEVEGFLEVIIMVGIVGIIEGGIECGVEE